MIRFLIPAVVLLTACSEEPVGQSVTFDAWENQPVQPAVQSPEVVALNDQIESRRRENALREARAGGDAALVASLEAAIETAGNDAAAAQSVMPSVIETNQPDAFMRGGTQVITQVAPEAPVTVIGSPAIEASPVQPTGSTIISDNSFNTVTQQQTIESDRERLAALSQSTVVLEAQPLPERQDSVNLAAFARSTSHKIGERLYRRSFRGSASSACRKYGNPDSAQRVFLAQGGPQNDRLKLDPDGDGFVCGWSPIPFRNLKVGG